MESEDTDPTPPTGAGAQAGAVAGAAAGFSAFSAGLIGRRPTPTSARRPVFSHWVDER